MVGIHFSKYSNCQAQMKNSVYGFWFTVKFMLFDWSCGFPKAFLKLLLMLLFPLYFVLGLFLTIMFLLGYFINLVPIVRYIYSLVYVLIWNIAAFLAVIITIYDSNHYTDELQNFDGGHIF